MIEIKCTAADTIGIDELTEFQGALKERTDADIEKITKSIRKHGFSFPFFVWKHKDEHGEEINHVFDGHGRLLALKRMRAQGEEIPALPVSYIKAETEAEAKELLLKLNSQYGRMTAESVAEFLDGLKIDLSDLQLPDGVLNLSKIDAPEETKDDDDVPGLDLEDTPSSIRGEIYQLGKHRLMCGDSTSADDMARLMGESKADLIITDPPYNVDYKGKGKNGLKIQNDNMEDNAFLNFLTDAFGVMFGALKAGGVFYIWYAQLKGVLFENALKNAGGKIRQYIIWVKNHLCMGLTDYQWRHEPCLYGWKEGAGHYWEGRRDLSTVFDETRGDWKKMSKEQLIAELKRFDSEVKTTIIYEDRPSRSEAHPTMKPVRLFERLIMNSSKAEDVVLDPFGGSGTSIIASEKLNRTCYTMELDPRYCDVIRRRWTKWAEENGIDAGSGKLK